MNLFKKILILLVGVVICVQAVPPVLNYAGQVAVNGESFDGNGLFKFALVNADGATTYWSNDGTSVDGAEPQASVAIAVNGGLYSILLGNTAQQGMGAIDPAIFAQHSDAKLRVWFSDGVNGFQQLSPDRPFASVPYAFNSESADTALNADTAKTAESANIAMAVQTGAITKQMLGSDVLTDINATIGMNRLSSEVTEKLNQEKTTTNYNAPSVGSLLAVPYGSDAPAGYSLYQRGEPKALVWEQLSEASSDLNVSLSVSSTIQDEIFMTRGHPPSNQILKFNPKTNQLITNIHMQTPRWSASTANFNDHFYVIGGMDENSNLSSVEIYDPNKNQWSFGPSLPVASRGGASIVFNNELYYFSGIGQKGVYKLNHQANTWILESNMTSIKWLFELVIYENKIWVLGGRKSGSGNPHSNGVEIYDPISKTWASGVNMVEKRAGISFRSWVKNDLIFVAGGGDGTKNHFSIEAYDMSQSSWELVGNLPTKGGVIEIVGNYIYLIKGELSSEINTDYFYRANLEVFDLYRKDGDAPVGTPVVQSEYADGSVTGSKIASKTIGKDQISDSILKYLKPQITFQPQASTIYAGGDGSVSFSAEGKYLTYQWKKDGVDLTGETNATLKITDANVTLHDGNYSVVVSNDFGSVESLAFVLDINKSFSTYGLTAWYPFDNNASDMSGNGGHGLIFGAQPIQDRFLKTGKAYFLDGQNDRIRINHEALNSKNAFSISMWIKPLQGSTYFFSAANSTKDNEFTLHFVQSNNLRMVTKNKHGDGGTKYTSSFSTSGWFGNWIHLGFTRLTSSSQVKVYLNGNLLELFSVSNGVLNVSQNGLWIGADQDSVGGGWEAGNYYHGSIDDVRIYDRALSAEEVQALYNLGQ